MAQTRRARKSKAQRKRKSKIVCSIPIQRPALQYLSSQQKPLNDFYEFVNKDWLSTVKIPGFENDFGISEEVERCIYKKSLEILSNTDHPAIVALRSSCLHGRVQHVSVEYLQSILTSLQCIQTSEDVIHHFSALAKCKIQSIFNYQYHMLPNKEITLRLDANFPSLPLSLYNNPHLVERYKVLLDTVGNLCKIDNLSQIFEFEKTLAFKSDELWSDNDYPIRGSGLLSKFPKIPWKKWFEVAELEGWKSMTVYYNSPRWIRYLGKVLQEVPVNVWKLFLAKVYIFHAMQYLPPPFDDLEFGFFGRNSQGQKEKVPQMELFVNTVYKYMAEIYSKIFWDEAGQPGLYSEIQAFSKTLVRSAKKRVAAAEWLQKASRIAAIEKINKMSIECVHPSTHFSVATYKVPTLDSKNLLKNIFDLGDWNTRILFHRIGMKTTFWDEGIYRVNAYYFNETNQIIIPYGTVLSPFYSMTESKGWNYGALGSIIGHEMCHGFDEDGKDYNAAGEKKKWWSRSDNLAYRFKTRALIELFEKQKVYNRHVSGDKTLSENIADLGGLAISLEALKEEISGYDEKEKKKEIQDFFIGYATSWRTKYREEKMKRAIENDPHAPAFLRVNLVVSQFQEWYDAFHITEESDMYIAPEKRIMIF